MHFLNTLLCGSPVWTVPGLPGYCSHRTLQGLPYGHSLQKKVEKNVKKELTKDRLCVILTKSVAGVRKQAQPVRNGILAQLGEHLPYKQRVIGSSPIGPIPEDISIFADSVITAYGEIA